MRRLSGFRLPFTLALIFAAAVMLAGAAPARAQDLFGFLRLLFEPSVRAPYPRYQYRVPHMQRRLRRPKIVRTDPVPATKPVLKAKVPGEVTNPVPELLADSTLRRGDIVMFPDGARVFVGQSRSQHELGDFEPVSASNKAVPHATRKLLAHVRPGRNDAWAAEMPASGGRIAANGDVETTGSITRRRRR